MPNGLNNVTIEFRQFGVKLNVTPVVQDNGEIRLKVAPEVSQLDYSHSVKIDGFELPSLAMSRASTTVSPVVPFNDEPASVILHSPSRRSALVTRVRVWMLAPRSETP